MTLAEKYRVSRSVIRDAVKILVGKGLLEVRRGIGTKVRNRLEWGILDNDVLAWHQSAPMNRKFLMQLHEFRLVIEPKAAQLAARNGMTDDYKSIEEAIHKMRENINSSEAFVEADANFHRLILLATDNEFLSAMDGIVFTSLLSSIRLTNRDAKQNEASLSLHQDAANSIFAKKPEEAEQRMFYLLSDAKVRLTAEV
jgi:DNA-binding FadR family transcriptional regulator